MGGEEGFMTAWRRRRGGDGVETAWEVKKESPYFRRHNAGEGNTDLKQWRRRRGGDVSIMIGGESVFPSHYDEETSAL